MAADNTNPGNLSNRSSFEEPRENIQNISNAQNGPVTISDGMGPGKRRGIASEGGQASSSNQEAREAGNKGGMVGGISRPQRIPMTMETKDLD